MSLATVGAADAVIRIVPDDEPVDEEAAVTTERPIDDIVLDRLGDAPMLCLIGVSSSSLDCIF